MQTPAGFYEARGGNLGHRAFATGIEFAQQIKAPQEIRSHRRGMKLKFCQ